MAQVQANVDHLKQLKRDMQKATQEIDEALRRVERSLSRASWNDPVRAKFEEEIKSVKSTVSKATNERFGALVTTLDSKIRKLEEYGS